MSEYWLTKLAKSLWKKLHERKASRAGAKDKPLIPTEEELFASVEMALSRQ